MKKQEVIDYIFDLFIKKGGDLYGGEVITQLEHGLQAAYFAKEAGASNNLVVAALLHDIGHLLHNLPDNATEDGIDDIHEELGAQFLTNYFNQEVVESVKLHVTAKRYLCLVEADYFNTLSPTSQASLVLQGGIMNQNEKIEFEKNDFYLQAVALRKWDDKAKIPNFKVNSIEYYKDSILNALN